MTEISIVVAVLLAVGIALLAWLAIRGRSASADEPSAMNTPNAGLGMSIGMLLGAILGAIVWLSTGQFVFWVIFVGGGLSVGLAIGSSYARRQR
ncbi:MAG: hypothetical protein OEV61_09940 [Chloroflexota bacterium]|jgi:hypothetical protein|nr:hypothetical protein [Chloroflexota bacterium]MDH5243534.1 hypothetical protein [Chloroflexota bacterium]